MTSAAEKLIDWRLAGVIGERVAVDGQGVSRRDQDRLSAQFSELIPQAEGMVEQFTGLGPGGSRSRAWVMSRGQWMHANLAGFQQVLEPFAANVLAKQGSSLLSPVRRKALGGQVGGLMGYVARKVLGQYDLFLPADDQGIVYFVGPNIVAVERKFGFPERDFRLWLGLHEVAHKVQFGGVPWMRGYVQGLIDSYLATVELDPKRLMETLRRAVDQVRRGDVEWRGFGWIFLLMTPEQRQMFKRMQAVMSLLEGHATFVMDQVAQRAIPGAATFKARLHERRNPRGAERAFQKAIGFDLKVRQYDQGERFVAEAVRRVGMDGFNRVWEDPGKLPTLEEITQPAQWLFRVGSS